MFSWNRRKFYAMVHKFTCQRLERVYDILNAAHVSHERRKFYLYEATLFASVMTS